MFNVKRIVLDVLNNARKGRYGVFLKNKAYLFFLGDGIPRNISHREVLLLKKELEKYDIVIVRQIWNERIGEFVPRFLHACLESYESSNRGKKIKYVYFYTDYIKVIRELDNLVSKQKYITIVPQDKRAIYACALGMLNNVYYEDNEQDGQRDLYVDAIDCSWGDKLLRLSDEQEQKCEKTMKLIGLNKPFVCVSNRDRAYMDSEFGYDKDYRNSDFSTRNLAIEYLGLNGIQCVRMGKIVMENYKHENCVPYAEKYWNELMDLYLSKECKFFLCDNSGVNTLAHAYGRPIVVVNDIAPQCLGYGGMPQRKEDILIFKKFYSKEKNRILSVREMIDIQYNLPYDAGDSYKKQGIELIDNTPEEILEATREMNEILDGKIVYSQEDNERQQLYWDIVDENYKKRGLPICNSFRGRIGRDFLRNNDYLLK